MFSDKIRSQRTARRGRSHRALQAVIGARREVVSPFTRSLQAQSERMWGDRDRGVQLEAVSISPHTMVPVGIPNQHDIDGGNFSYKPRDPG